MNDGKARVDRDAGLEKLTPGSTTALRLNSVVKWTVTGIVLLILAIFSILMAIRVSKGGRIRLPSALTTKTYPSITIAKGVWSDKAQVYGRHFRVVSINPPVRRYIMVNDDPGRITPLPASTASEVNVGDNVQSFRCMIMPDESSSVSIIEYEFLR